MVNDPYRQAKALMQDLQAQGLNTWARKIEDIVDGGSTATEILMGLRWLTAELIRLEALDAGTRKRVDLLRASLDVLLS